jgi:hypothetical protein
MSSFREQTEENLNFTRTEIERAQGEADTANERLADLQRQARAMQAALDVMDGIEPATTPSGVVIPPVARTVLFPLQGADARMVPPPMPVAPTGLQYAKLNGIDILLEPGMRVGKNAFGEDVIVPTNSIDPPLMAEPVKPESTLAAILPPIGKSDTFGSQDPNELFS